MKKFIFSLCIAIVSATLSGCLSTSVNYSHPKEYKVLSTNEYFDLPYRGGFKYLEKNDIEGIKVTKPEIFFGKDRDQKYLLKVDELYVSTEEYREKHPDLFERLEKHKEYLEYRNQKEGYHEVELANYTVYLSYKTVGNFFDYEVYPVLDEIEGLPTLAEIEKGIENEKERIKAKKEADKKANEKKMKEFDALGKKIAKGYVYHGTNEAEENAELFENGALEEGHAYYIENFIIESNGAIGAVITNLFFEPEYFHVNYASQKVKAQVVSAGKSILGPLPLTVVVAGGRGPSYIPTVLGLLE